MSGLLFRAGLGLALRHPWPAGSAVAGIAIGVAVVSGMEVAVESARRAFLLSSETVMGRATHVVESGPGGLPESAYAAFRRLRPDLRVAPIVSDYVRAADGTGRVLHLVGIDPTADHHFRSFAGGAGAGGAEGVGGGLMTVPGAAVVSRTTARALGVAPGERFGVEAGGRVRELELVAELSEPDAFARASLADLLITDITTAQDVLEAGGRLSRLDLILDGDAAEVRAALPPGATLAAAGARGRAVAEMTRAFEFNLRMLSLLALVIAGLLVYNAMTFLVLRRRESLGVLRALGVTRGGLFRAVLAEAAVLGAAGASVGAALGLMLADVLTGLVLRTVNDLYFVTTLEGSPAGAGAVAAAAGLGAAASVLAAAPAAREAANTAPRAAMRRSHVEERARRLGRYGAVAGGALAAFALGALWAGRFGYAALAAALLAACALAPLAVRIGATDAARRLPRMLRLAARSVAARPSRTGVAAAALTVAMAAMVSVSIMIESFRSEVQAWLEQTLEADFFVSRPAPGRDGLGAHRTLSPELVARLSAISGVVATSRQFRTRLETVQGEVRVSVLAADREPSFRLRSGDPASAWRRLGEEDAVLVSEPFAARYGEAESLALKTPHGLRRFRVAGVFQDFTSEHGVVLLSAAAYARHWGEPAVHSLAIWVADPEERGAVALRLAEVAAGAGLRVRSARDLLDASLAVFDRTFRVTEVLRWLAALAAFAAVLGALLALGLEREPELALLRALGTTRRGLFALLEAESAIVGLIAGILAAPLGLVLAAVLVHVINRRAFGWSMALEFEPIRLVEPIVLAVATGLLAGIGPGVRAARLAPRPGRAP